MEKISPGRTIAYGIISFGLFALIFCLTGGREEKSRGQEVQIVAFGDSTFGEVRDESSIPAMVGRILGKSAYNAGLGGTCLARTDREYRLAYGQDSLSMAALSKAVASGDFGPQQAVWMRESVREYFDEAIDEMAGIDYSTVEILLLEYGQNDYNGGFPISDEEDPLNEYTFTGALRSVIGTLRKAYPDMRIVLVTPIYSWYTAMGKTCEEYDSGYGVMEDYVNAQLAVAEELGVEVIDLYHDIFPHEQWSDWELYTRDGMHPNEAGRELIAEIIAEYLKEGQGI